MTHQQPLIALISVLPCTLVAAQPQHKPKLNVVIVMADQFRGEAMGFLGKEAVKTPHLDRFAQQSVVLNQAVSSYPVSSPARAMFLTGAYPHHNGVQGNCNSLNTPYDIELREDLTCWSDILKQEGYKTGYLGKWHLDKPYQPYIDCANNKGKVAWNEWCPPERRHGFDYWVAYGTYDYHLKPMYWNTEATRDEFYYVDRWGPEYEADLAVEFIHQNKDTPFALMVSMNPPHADYQYVPQKYKDLYVGLNVDSIAASYPNLVNEVYFKKSLADYYACITGVDEQFGRIMKALEEQRLLNNTIVVFTSDHGDMMGLHNVIGKNVCYEAAMRIPMMIYAPNLHPRQDNELLFSIEDFYPTLMSMMGYQKKIPATVETLDLSKQIAGSRKNMPNSQLYFMAWESGIYTNKDAANGSRGLRNHQYTFCLTWKDKKNVDTLLFDRVKDPYQLKNIASTHPKVVKRMKKELLSRLSVIQDPAVNNYKL